MKKFHLILRIGLGLMLLMFGLNKFFWFMPDFDFTGYSEAEHLFKTLRFSGHDQGVGKGYIMGLVGLTEVVVGLLLVIKKWVPFALVMLVPISINVVFFHAFVNLPNIGPALFIAIANGYLIHKHWASYRSLFS
ncbi:MAG: DoxX family membrane protein [Flavobacteriaceae bacterium]|nr:DoxX family membrane protein [Flavobacteriaceae bacterium]